ncbi:hypothetical protein GYMLUDRAFT_157831 [Collybiopsis luxurians FD-317 M1]|nr:hypothetical protein GYMLUDRAFT_157831 [Collybiopsis luxurians FD-317 M1]
MVNKPKSQALKTQIARAEKDALEKETVKRYKMEQTQELAEGEKRKGLRKICQEVSDEHFMESGRRINLNHNTLHHHVHGKRTISEFNQTKQWLSAEEEDVIVKYVIEMAFPPR